MAPPVVVEHEDIETPPSFKEAFVRKAEWSHSAVPGLRKIPLRALGIILLIAIVNAVVWIAAGIVLVSKDLRSTSLPPHGTGLLE